MCIMRTVAKIQVLLLVFTLTNCTPQDPEELYDGGIDYDSFVPIAAIDPAEAGRVSELFDQVGIPNIIEGSVVYGVSVPLEMKAKAVAVLKADARSGGYHVEF